MRFQIDANFANLRATGPTATVIYDLIANEGSSAVQLIATTNNPLEFWTNNTKRWGVASTGELQGFESDTLKTSIQIIPADSQVQISSDADGYGLQFGTANGSGTVAHWRILPTGELAALGAMGWIQNVKDPIDPQDAATMNWVENAARFQNICHNGNMGIWQRGTSQTVNKNSNGRVYFMQADRWGVLADAVDAGTGFDNNTFTCERFASGLAGSPWCTRIKISSVRTDANGALHLAQEIDRDTVLRARGKKLTLIFKWAKGTGFSSGSATYGIRCSRGSTLQNFATYTGGTTNPLTVSVPAASIPGVTLGSNTVSVSAVLDADVTCASVYFTLPFAYPQSVTNYYLDITDVVVAIGEFPTIAEMQSYPLAGGSDAGELALCQRWYEKSYDEGEYATNITDVGATCLVKAYGTSPGYAGSVRYTAKKQRAGTVTLYSTSTGDPDKVYGIVGAADVAATVEQQGTSGFTVKASAGDGVPLNFHWTAEHDFFI
jgi:hypothetical protein